MIDYANYDHSMTMSCDGSDCIETIELRGDFRECINEAKENGWRVVHADNGSIDEEWEHYCPRCWANRGAKGVFK